LHGGYGGGVKEALQSVEVEMRIGRSVGAIVAVGIGVGVALAASLGAAGIALGIGVAMLAFVVAPRLRRRPIGGR
jgi:hypothetical protein